jgi:hypothetical protein
MRRMAGGFVLPDCRLRYSRGTAQHYPAYPLLYREPRAVPLPRHSLCGEISMRALQTLAALLLLSLLAGCHVSNHNGKDNDVDVRSPFGSMHIKTDDNVDMAAIGLSIYPGSTVWKDDAGEAKDHDSHSADINMSFGDFHLGVKATALRTTDSSDKILAFYRKDMARYGDVIECKGTTVIGTPTRTAQGLTCNTDENHGKHIEISEANQLELRAGSEQHMHIVEVQSKDGAEKIGLVALDLPTHLEKHDSKDIE